ncbi:MAG: hypothetical protein J6K49_00350 [Clostridia bacterium]|nr:hypothetical protein [Clostridia bacterium]
MLETKNVYASLRGTPEILSLFQRAKDLSDIGIDNHTIFLRAEEFFVENFNTINFNKLNRKKATYKYEGVVPSSLKIKLNDSIDAKVESILKERYNIKVVQSPWKIRIVLLAYITYFLEKQPIEVDSKLNNINSLKVDLFEQICNENDIDILLKIKDILQRK